MSPSIVVGLDTNILCNYGQLEHFQWLKLFPDVTRIKVLVSDKVQKEMNKHKDTGKSLLRKRAMEFQALLRRSEDKNYELKIDRDDVEVLLVFLPRVKKSLLSNDLLDLDEADDLIVAEYYAARDAYGDIVILSNDAGVIRMARALKIHATRPDAWEMVNQDQEVIDLKKEIQSLKSTMPELVIENLSYSGVREVALDFIDFDFSSFKSHLVEAVHNCFELPTATQLFDESGYGEIGVDASAAESVRQCMENYGRDRSMFFDYYKELDEDIFLGSINRLLESTQVDLSVKNIGRAPDNIITIEIKSVKNARLVFQDEVRRSCDFIIDSPPAVPDVSIGFGAAFQIPDFDPLGENWDYFDVSNMNSLHHFASSESYFNYRCRTLLHECSLHFRFHIVPFDLAEVSVAELTIRSEKLPSAIVKIIKIAPQKFLLSPQDLERVWDERGGLMSKHKFETVEKIRGYASANSKKWKMTKIGPEPDDLGYELQQ